MRIKLSRIIIALLVLSVTGNNAVASVPPDIKSFVVSLFMEKHDRFVPNGTGFFVGINNLADKKTVSVYLITTKPVLCRPCTTEYMDKIFIRLNKRDGGSEIGAIPIRIKDEKRTVFFHTDPSVDIVAIPFLPDQKKFDFNVFPSGAIASREEFAKLNIRVGTDIFFTGLFTPDINSKRAYPVVRFGRIASLNKEKIEWQGLPRSLYLMETCASGGNSGTPIFFYLGSEYTSGFFSSGNPVFKLVGVIQGTYPESCDVKAGQSPVADLNTGITAIVPSYKVHELLLSDKLKAHRGF